MSSFRDELELSLLATALAEKGVPHTVPWREGGRPIQVLPPAGIFGANASGKSNLLRAMSDMRRHVLYSFSHGDPERGMPRRAFLLNPAQRNSPSRFEVDLVLHGIRHEYGFAIDDTQVLEEWAFRYPRGKAALLFRREGANVTLGERNRAKGRAIIEILRPNSLMLSAAAAANHPDLAPLRRWFATPSTSFRLPTVTTSLSRVTACTRSWFSYRLPAIRCVWRRCHPRLLTICICQLRCARPWVTSHGARGHHS